MKIISTFQYVNRRITFVNTLLQLICEILYFPRICPKLCGSEGVEKAIFWKTIQLYCFLWLLSTKYELGSENYKTVDTLFESTSLQFQIYTIWEHLFAISNFVLLHCYFNSYWTFSCFNLRFVSVCIVLFAYIYTNTSLIARRFLDAS